MRDYEEYFTFREALLICLGPIIFAIDWWLLEPLGKKTILKRNPDSDKEKWQDFKETFTKAILIVFTILSVVILLIEIFMFKSERILGVGGIHFIEMLLVLLLLCTYLVGGLVICATPRD